jgi:tetratricopeptide (TPR) repeat protein
MTQKKYLYLVQTDGQRLPHYQDISSVESDVMYLSWKKPEIGMVYLPNSSWTQGRNHLLKIAKTAHHRYQYYIFIDDDIELVQGNWREFEQYLSQYQPAIATPHYLEYGVQYATHGETISPYEFDACFNAFHHDVVFDNLVLPYIECFDHISWYVSQQLMIHLAKILYGDAVVQFNQIQVRNQKHRDYPRGIGLQFDESWLFQEIFQEIPWVKNRYKPFCAPGYEAAMILPKAEGNYRFTLNQLQTFFQQDNGQFKIQHYNQSVSVLEQILSLSQLDSQKQALVENPSNPNTYQQLAYLLAEQNQWPQAIAGYHRALHFQMELKYESLWPEQSSREILHLNGQNLYILPGQAHQDLEDGQRLSHSGNQGFVFFGPYKDIEDGFYRVQVNIDWPESVSDISPSIIFDIVAPCPITLYKSEIAYPQTKLQVDLDFIGAKNTEFRFATQGSAFIVKSIELTRLYPAPGEKPTAFYYFDVACQLRYQDQPQKSELALWQVATQMKTIEQLQQLSQQITEILPASKLWNQGYTDLGQLLYKQGQEELAKWCYERGVEGLEAGEIPSVWLHWGLQEAQQGHLQEAIASFQKAVSDSDASRLYQHLWLGLNEIQPLMDESLLNDAPINAPVIYEYFRETSSYQIIDLLFLTEADQDFLAKHGLSVANLRRIQESNLSLEEIYINHFNSSSPVQLSKQASRTSILPLLPDTTPNREFQQTIVETGYICSICPFTGQILRSNQSLMLDDPGYATSIFYRFTGRETFYLFASHWIGGLLFLYIPRLELIINLSLTWKNYLDYGDIVTRLKKNMVFYWKQVKQYLFNPAPKKTVAVCGGYENLGHYFWNDISGLDFLAENQLLDKIDKYLVGSYEPLKVNDIYPEIPVKDILRVESKNFSSLLLANNYFAVRLTDILIKESLAKKLYQASLKNCSTEFLATIEQAKKHFPLIWINLRSHSKAWISQVEGSANIIKTLSQNYPNIGIIFDGWKDEEDSMEQIKALIPPSISTYNGLGCPMHETIVWAFAIDVYISIVGSGLTLVTWIANKPGVAHSNYGHLKYQSDWWPEVRENIIPPLFLSTDQIQQADIHAPYGDYDCDWKVIYDGVFKIVQQLESSQ